MTKNRRPIKARSAGWAKDLANALLKQDVSPNQISVASALFALLGAGVLILDNGVIGSIMCALSIQLRLLCNLLDGMVAIEGGKNPTSAFFTTNSLTVLPIARSSLGLATP